MPRSLRSWVLTWCKVYRYRPRLPYLYGLLDSFCLLSSFVCPPGRVSGLSLMKCCCCQFGKYVICEAQWGALLNFIWKASRIYLGLCFLSFTSSSSSSSSSSVSGLLELEYESFRGGFLDCVSRLLDRAWIFLYICRSSVANRFRLGSKFWGLYHKKGF